MLLLLLALASTDYVGQTVDGEVGEGNYTYYTLKQPGEVRLELTSLQGDADLYVAGEEEEHPTFMFDKHYMSSTTCGVDILALTKYFKRPVHIGVYGHPRNSLSKYRLDVVVVEQEEQDFFAYEQDGYSESATRDDAKTKGEGRARSSDKSGDDSDFWSGEQSTVKVIFTILRHILEIVLDIMI